MKLSLVRILTEEEVTAARQVNKFKGQNPAAQINPFADKIAQVSKRLKLTPEQSIEIFSGKNVLNTTQDPEGPAFFSIVLSLPTAQALVSKYGDLEKVAQFIENMAGESFMKNLVKGNFEGFYVPEMEKIKHRKQFASPLTPQYNNSVEDFSHQIDQDD